jgi:uncharacterized protein YbcV (DUF1398 family)
MTQTVKAILAECAHASDEGRITFPEVVATLLAAGVERYHVDLQGVRSYHLRNGLSETVVGAPVAVPVAERFSAADVAAAIRASQNGEIGYREFCGRIAQAGCPGYIAFLAGRRVLYYGRDGDCHVEHFPGTRT